MKIGPILCSLLVVVSCGSDKALKEKLSIDNVPAQISNLASSQLILLGDICQAYRSKNSNYRKSAVLGKDFSLKYENKMCGGQFDEATFTASLVSQDNTSTSALIYDSFNSYDYVRIVQTHEQGRLKNICEDFLKGESNQYSNSVENGDELIQYEFYKKDHNTLKDLPAYKVSYFSKDDEGNFSNYLVEQFIVNTDPNLGNLVGIVLRVDRLVDCKDGDETSPSNIQILSQEILSTP